MYSYFIKFAIYLSLFSFSSAQDCILQVPKNPLKNGLFDNWILTTNDDSDVVCSQTNPQANVFVEATILDTRNGQLFVYFPLVVGYDTTPAAPTFSTDIYDYHVVTLHFGTNGNSLTLIPTIDYSSNYNSLIDGNCVNGIPNGSIFGQFAYCNAVNFFKKVNEAIYSKYLIVPPLQNSLLGDICPTTRSFSVVDQDQSDNVLSQYLLLPDNSVAQDYEVNKAKFPNAKILGNGSLLDIFINVAIGCVPFKAPDLIDNNILRSSLALNEIQANLNVNSQDIYIYALTPSIGPMTLDNGVESLIKVNLYRAGVNQPPLDKLNQNDNILYCNQLISFTPTFLSFHSNELANFKSPEPEIATNLLNFLANRFVNSLQILNCQALTGKSSPISVNLNENGLVVSTNIPTSPFNPYSIPTEIPNTQSTQHQSQSQSQSTQSTQPTQPTQPTQATQPTQPTQPTQATQASTQETQASFQSTQSSQATQASSQSFQSTQPTQDPSQSTQAASTQQSTQDPSQSTQAASTQQSTQDPSQSTQQSTQDPSQPSQPTQASTQSTQDPSQSTQAASTQDLSQSTTRQQPIQPTQPNTNILNLCGTSAYNVNCNQLCNVNSDCTQNGFFCFKVNLFNNVGICNFNNFCGSSFEKLDCIKPCPNGIDLDCENGNFCFKDNNGGNVCNQIPKNFTTTTKTKTTTSTTSTQSSAQAVVINNGYKNNENTLYILFFLIVTYHFVL